MRKVLAVGATIFMALGSTAFADDWFDGCLAGVAEDRPDLSSGDVEAVCSCMVSDLSQDQLDEIGNAPDGDGRDGKLAALSSSTADAVEACGY